MKRDLLTLVVGGAVFYLIANILYPLVSSQQNKPSLPAIRAKSSPPSITLAPHECDCENEYYRRELTKRWSESSSICFDAFIRIIDINGSIETTTYQQMSLISNLGYPDAARANSDKKKEQLQKREDELRKEMSMLLGKTAANMRTLADILQELRKLGDHSKDSQFQNLLDQMEKTVESVHQRKLSWQWPYP